MGKRVQGTLKKLATQLISDMTKEIVAKGRVASGNLKS